MEDVIKIGCPNCGAVLAVKNMPGIENKSVTCPICKKTSPFTSYKLKTAAADEEEDHTRYAGESDSNGTASAPSAGTGENFTLGKLNVLGTSLSFQLLTGRNVIGRKAEGSRANMQIPCLNRRMSREHLVVEVKKIQGAGFVHYVSLNKEQVNPTFIDGNPLEYGDKIVLKDGDIIKLPDTEIRFEIPDGEKTEI